MYSSCNFGHMLSVGAIHFEDRLCTTKKGGIGGGGRVQRGVLCTLQLPWLTIEKPWSPLAGPFLSSSFALAPRASVFPPPLPYTLLCFTCSCLQLCLPVWLFGFHPYGYRLIMCKLFLESINPLTSDDQCTHHATLGTYVIS